jgi:acetate kinase
MGFSVLDGLVMATRCGALDPGVILYLARERGMAISEIEDVLYHRSGLTGLSGIGGDMQILLASEDPRAREALDLYIWRIAREAGALTSTLSGLDNFIFTAGVGENASAIRTAVCARLGWLGIETDEAANLSGGPCISTPASCVSVWVIPTDEEQVIARGTLACLREQAA